MNPDLQIQDPYKELNDEQKWRICADVSMSDHLLVKAVAPFRGVMQAMVNMLFKSVVDECRKHGIIYYSDENYAKFRAIIQRRSAPESPVQIPIRNDSGRTSEVRPGVAHPPDEQPSTPVRADYSRQEPEKRAKRSVRRGLPKPVKS